MAEIVVCGGGVCGLVTGMLLAKDGHEVTVLERDPAPPPTPEESWTAWERRGVNQFRLPHFLMPRFRYEMAKEIPELVDALVAAGGYAFNAFGPFRDVVAEPDRFDIVTARRPVVEAVTAAVAEATPGLTVRRGVALAGLDVDGAHVTGVRTADGDVVKADLVVAATGRRSPLATWLVEAGRPAPILEEEDSGFVYYGRYLKARDDGPFPERPLIDYWGSIGLLVLPGDNRTWGVGLIASSEDAAMRRLRQEEPWQAVMRSLPDGASYIDGEPISDLVAMAGIEDRWRRFVVDGEPVATGVAAVADAWAATNPTLGRGISLGTMHAQLLRDTVRDVGLDDPRAFALAFDDVTERVMTPWYRSTIWQDRERLASMRAEAGGPPHEPDALWTDLAKLGAVMMSDLDLAVAWLNSSAALFETPETMLQNPDVKAKLEAVGEVPPHAGPSREELLSLVA